MRVYQTNEIKNIALLGSAGSGKTTLAESLPSATISLLNKSMATLYSQLFSM